MVKCKGGDITTMNVLYTSYVYDYVTDVYLSDFVYDIDGYV